MKKYKIELKKLTTYIIDILADTQDEAEKEAIDILWEKINTGIDHYSETEEEDIEVSNVFDVSDTDDTFNPENN